LNNTIVTNCEKRMSDRQTVAMPARLTWKDQRGATRFASVVTRDVSEHGVFVECPTGVSIPLYRLVHVQLERDARNLGSVPYALRQGRVLAAVYRVVPPKTSGQRQGFALRMMVDPKRQPADSAMVRATA